jgi:hypothetical protein
MVKTRKCPRACRDHIFPVPGCKWCSTCRSLHPTEPDHPMSAYTLLYVYPLLTVSVLQSNSGQYARVRWPARAQTAFACTRRRTQPRACLSPGTGTTGRCTRSRSRASASSSSRRSSRGHPRRPASCRNQPNLAGRLRRAGSPASPPYGGRSRGLGRTQACSAPSWSLCRHRPARGKPGEPPRPITHTYRDWIPALTSMLLHLGVSRSELTLPCRCARRSICRRWSLRSRRRFFQDFLVMNRDRLSSVVIFLSL